MEPKKKKLSFRIIICILGIILGIATIVIGIATDKFNYRYWGYGEVETYGGDAYTGIQNATAKTVTNVYNLYQTVQAFSKSFLIVWGILIILHYALALHETIKKGG